MPGPIYDNLPDPISADAVDVLAAGKSVPFLFDPVAGNYRAQRTTDQPTLPGSGAILAQTSGTIDATSRSLPSVPTGAGYARLQLHGAGLSARYDGTAASLAASEELYDAGGTLELVSAAEIAGFRYISQAGTGTYSVIYRSA